jgi:hypothetical protein
MRLPTPKAEITDWEGYLEVTAIFLGIVWLFASVEAAHNADADLFASLGALGLLSVALFVWTRSAVLKRYEAQIQTNLMHAIAHLHVMGLARPQDMNAAGDLAWTASWYAKWLGSENSRLRNFEAVLIGLATIQLAFGARFLNRLLLCGEWKC